MNGLVLRFEDKAVILLISALCWFTWRANVAKGNRFRCRLFTPNNRPHYPWCRLRQDRATVDRYIFTWRPVTSAGQVTVTVPARADSPRRPRSAVGAAPLSSFPPVSGLLHLPSPTPSFHTCPPVASTSAAGGACDIGHPVIATSPARPATVVPHYNPTRPHHNGRHARARRAARFLPPFFARHADGGGVFRVFPPAVATSRTNSEAVGGDAARRGALRCGREVERAIYGAMALQVISWKMTGRAANVYVFQCVLLPLYRITTSPECYKWADTVPLKP